MSKNLKLLTPAQKKANARNQLFRQIHGYSLERFIDRAVKEESITPYEKFWLDRILASIAILKQCQFEGSKEVGLHPRRRCFYCNGIARWKLTVLGKERYCCNKHKEEFERDNKQNVNGEYMVTYIQPINPNK